MKSSAGFTVIELLAGILLLSLVVAIGFDRYQAVQTVHRDQDRKTAINEIHRNLEEVVKPKLGGYPRILSASQLSAARRSVLTDPDGNKIGTGTSDYRYEPTGCAGTDVCRAYTLSAYLEKENDYVTSSSPKD